MLTFVIGLFLAIVGPIAAISGNLFHQATGLPVAAGRVGGAFACLFGVVLMVMSTAIYVESNQGGVVNLKFGQDLPEGGIVATKGEKGPQAKVLPPGWHFGYLPIFYDLESFHTIEIPAGNIGLVKTTDGKPLPEGDVFAPRWKTGAELQMLDAQYFLTEGNGYKGDQVSVLLPGEYRPNPRLFSIDVVPVLEVPVGQVAVIKANAGEKYQPKDGSEVEQVNGTPIVPKGFRGLWREALTPDAYPLHPRAHKVTMVQTTIRTFSYTGQTAIDVRTKDGFEFPVDVRVTARISTENAPYVVALLGDPDARSKSGFTKIEELIIIPTVRAIFRNTAESRNALQYVNERSQIQDTATQQLREELLLTKIDVQNVYIADIRISDTPAGQKLLATQTDKEVALREQETFAEKERAQKARANAVRAEEEANQEVQQAQARSRVLIAQEDAKAEIAKAEGQAAAYQKKIEALGGVDNFVQLEIMNMMATQWKGDIPSVLVAGGSNGSSGVLGALLGGMLKEQTDKTKR